jgi:hypothetical protein
LPLRLHRLGHYPKIERVLIAVQFGRREARVSLRESP